MVSSFRDEQIPPVIKHYQFAINGNQRPEPQGFSPHLFTGLNVKAAEYAFPVPGGAVIPVNITIKIYETAEMAAHSVVLPQHLRLFACHL